MTRERKLGLILLAVLIGMPLLLAEAGYRALRGWRLARTSPSLSYRLTPSVYVEYDERHGERFKPNSECWVTYVEDGRVIWGTAVSRSNRDGLGGRTTFADYDRAAVKVLVFGDSFTHWNQDGVTWPDLLEDNLRRTLPGVAVLNFGRGAYGVLQMLDLAADEAEARRPDLVVIAAIGNDFNRARWWCKEVRRDGVTRWMLSSRPDEFLDYRVATDELLVHPAATREWCLRRLQAGGGPDPVLEQANAQFARIRDEVTAVRIGFRPFAFDRSYLFRRLTRGFPFEQGLNTVPQVDYSDYREDARTADNLRRLKATGIPLLLVYLPTADELKARECLGDRQSQRLMASLERMAGQPFRRLQAEYTGPVPAKMNLLPYDAHPSRAGLQLYADAVAPLVLERLRSRR